MKTQFVMCLLALVRVLDNHSTFRVRGAEKNNKIRSEDVELVIIT